MLLSIVTVCRNAEKTIRNTIESVLEQTFNDFEYLIVDGLSSDNTYDIICEYDERFYDKGISFRHISEIDNGIFDAMNKASYMAKGEWISFINADDKLYGATVLDTVFNYDLTKYDVVYGNVFRVGKDKSYIDKASPINNIILTMPFCHQSSFTRRELIKFDTNHITADYKLFLGLYLSGHTFFQIDEVIAQYSTEGFSNQDQYRTYLDVVNVKSEFGLVKEKSLIQKIKNAYHRIILDETALGHKALLKLNNILTEYRKR